MDSETVAACKLLVLSQMGHFPKPFNFTQATTLVSDSARIGTLGLKLASGQVTDVEFRTQVAPIDAECVGIAGLSCLEVLETGVDR